MSHKHGGKNKKKKRTAAKIVSFKLSAADFGCHRGTAVRHDLAAEWERPQVLLHRKHPCKYVPQLPMLSVLEAREKGFAADHIAKMLLAPAVKDLRHTSHQMHHLLR